MVKKFFLFGFLRKKDELLFFDDCMSFFWVYFWFLDKKVLIMTDFYHYCAEKKCQVYVVCLWDKLKKKYLLSLNSCEYELLSFVMIQINNWKKNVCLNENKTKIKNNNAYKKQDFYQPCWLLTTIPFFLKLYSFFQFLTVCPPFFMKSDIDFLLCMSMNEIEWVLYIWFAPMFSTIVKSVIELLKNIGNDHLLL